jgi:beta-glucanase (GH16 family)
MKSLILCLAAVIAVFALAGSAQARAQPALIFDDEFNGVAVSAPWVVNYGNGYAPNQCWSNDLAHVSESGGYLRLTATYEPTGGRCGTGYESGAISVPASAWSYLYGTAQARVKVPCQSGTGVWPGFWQYASQYGITNANGEIDSMEALDDHAGATVSQSIHGTGLNATSLVYGSQAQWCGVFHIYGNVWTPTSVTFTVDGRNKRTYSRSQFAAWPLVTPQAPVLSLLVGGYGGTPNPLTFPQTMLVDWVRVWN